MSPALAQALRHALARHTSIRRVVLPSPVVCNWALLRRPKEQVPLTLRPVSVLRPVHETPAELHAFVLQEFREAQRKRA